LQKKSQSSQLKLLEDKFNKNEFLDIQDAFDQDGGDDERERSKILVSIFNRRGQPKFRKKLLKTYERKCAITEFDFEQALEAAHILPYAENGTNEAWNGLLLRCDIHNLFDIHFITVHPETRQVCISPKLKKTKYEEELKTAKLRQPKDKASSPCKKALGQHYNECDWMKSKIDLNEIFCTCLSCQR
jgi:predicted restriction endonuclease